MILIRHGETEWNAHKMTQGMSDTVLSESGIWQAGRLGYRLQRMRINHVYASPLQRAKETGAIIAQYGNFPFDVDSDLREIRFGFWEGLTFNQIARRFPDTLAVWNAAPHECVLPGNGEMMLDVLARCRNFISRMKEMHADDCIVAVTHSIPAKLLVAEAIGLPLEQLHCLQIDNGGMNIIEYYSERSVLRLLNDISHLNQFRTMR